MSQEVEERLIKMVEETNQDVRNLTSVTLEMQKSLCILSTNMIAMQRDISGLKEDVAGLKEDVATLKTDVAQLKQDVVELREEQKAMEQRLTQKIEKEAEDAAKEHRIIYHNLGRLLKVANMELELVN